MSLIILCAYLVSYIFHFLIRIRLFPKKINILQIQWKNHQFLN